MRSATSVSLVWFDEHKTYSTRVIFYDRNDNAVINHRPLTLEDEDHRHICLRSVFLTHCKIPAYSGCFANNLLALDTGFGV